MFAEHKALEQLWATMLRVDVSSVLTRFEVWRAHTASWEAHSTHDYIAVDDLEQHLVIRALGTSNLVGFEQRLRLPGVGGVIVDLIPTATPGPSALPHASVTPAVDANIAADSVETFTSSYDVASRMDGECVEALWQVSPPSSPTSNASMPDLMSLTADEDDSPGPSTSQSMYPSRSTPPPESRPVHAETGSERPPTPGPSVIRGVAPCHPARSPSPSLNPSVAREITPPPSTQPRRTIVTPERSPTPGSSGNSGDRLTRVLLHAQARLRAQASTNGPSRPYRSIRMRPGRRRRTYVPDIIDLTGDSTDAEGEDCDFIDLTTSN